MVGFKNRYMVMEVSLYPVKDRDLIIITKSNLEEAIEDSILTNFGQCGRASYMNSFQVKYVNPTTNICIFRTSREDYQNVWAAITMLRSIKNCPVVFNLLDLSGSIRTCKIAALKCDESKFEQYKILAGDSLSEETNQRMQNCLGKLKTLEH